MFFTLLFYYIYNLIIINVNYYLKNRNKIKYKRGL